MAFDFPSSPSVNQEFTAGSVVYKYNGTGWTVKLPVDINTAEFVNVSGDTMTGDLNITGALRTTGFVLTGNATAGVYYFNNVATKNLSYNGLRFIFNDMLLVDSTVASTSPTTGALTVAGGVGVGGQINASNATGAGVQISGWDEDGGTNPVGGALWLGNNVAYQGRIHYGTGTGIGVLYIDNRQDNATGADIVLRTRASAPASTRTITMKNVDGALAIAATTASTSPTTGALTVAGGLGVGGPICVGNSTVSGAINGMVKVGYNAAVTVGIVCRPSQDTNSYAMLCVNASDVTIGSISTTSTVTAFNTSSGAELKEDLKSFDAGNIIDNTNVYDFKWRSTQERAYGVIAQQAVQVYPLAVTHQEASTEKGAERDEWWGVDYSKYVPVLLQELKALRARVAELEGKIEVGVKPS